MIKQIKMSFQMLRFAFGVRMCVICMVIFGAIGFLMEIFGDSQMFIGGFFIYMMSMWPVQLLYSVSIANEVGASPYKKQMQTSMPALVNLLGSLITISIVVVIRVVQYQLHPELAGAIINGMIVIGITALIIGLYTAMVYKFFWASAFIFAVTYVFTYTSFTVMDSGRQTAWMSFPLAIVCTYGLMLLGILVQYVTSLLVYKYPLSKRAQGAFMKKYL